MDATNAQALARAGYHCPVTTLTTIAIVIVAAAILRPAGYTQLESFITPGVALAAILSEWANVAFLLGAAATAFNSIIPIMWTPAYLFQHAIGNEADPTGREFKTIFTLLTGIGCFSPLIVIFTSLGVIDMIILFPAYNGIIALPITAIGLFWAVNDREVMGEHRNSRALSALNLVLVVLAVVLAPGIHRCDHCRTLTLVVVWVLL
jgi:manganese transport protein